MAANATNGLLLADQQWHNQNLANPRRILVLNLMPTKKNTELQFLHQFASLKQDTELTFIYPTSHSFKTCSRKLIAENYQTFSEIKKQFYDGLIITGAPVEKLDFHQVDYWHEFKKICDWGKRHTNGLLFECWAAQAALFLDFAIKKRLLKQKLFGIYPSIDRRLIMPQSRHSESVIDKNSLPKDLEITADSEIGPLILHSAFYHSTYITGHPEYQKDTLAKEYFRDINKGLKANKPVNYFKANKQINYCWQTSSTRIYQSWLNSLFFLQNKKAA